MAEPPQQPFTPPPAKFYTNSSSDYNYLVQKWAVRGWQNGCLVGIPLFMVVARRFSFKSTGRLDRVLKATWMGGAAGTITGGAFGAARYYGMDKHELRRRRIELQFSEKNLRRDGFATIGGVLTSLMVTALWWNHAPVITLIFGGSGIGTIAGVAGALVMDFQEPPGTSDSTNTREKEAAIKAGIVQQGE